MEFHSQFFPLNQAKLCSFQFHNNSYDKQGILGIHFLTRLQVLNDVLASFVDTVKLSINQ